VRLIYTLDKELTEKETGQSGKNPTLSCDVGMTGREACLETLSGSGVHF
jgi:hypothetical protein